MCSILIEAALVFAVCLALHVIIWRVRRPASYRAWLPLLAIIFFLVGSVLSWLMIRQRWLAIGEVPSDSVIEWTAVLVLHATMSSVYIIGYTLVSAFSPSIEILKLIERAPGGVTRTEIELPFLHSALGGNRVNNLLSDGLIRADGDRVSLGPQAEPIARLALLYRHAIGLPDGTGG